MNTKDIPRSKMTKAQLLEELETLEEIIRDQESEIKDCETGLADVEKERDDSDLKLQEFIDYTEMIKENSIKFGLTGHSHYKEEIDNVLESLMELL